MIDWRQPLPRHFGAGLLIRTPFSGHGDLYPKKWTRVHVLGYRSYNYRGVSKYHFPMYLKGVEFRFNH